MARLVSIIQKYTTELCSYLSVFSIFESKAILSKRHALAKAARLEESITKSGQVHKYMR